MTLTIRIEETGAELEVERDEFHPYEPSAYVWDAGWTCFDGDVEFFVSTSGDVYVQPENTWVGTAPAIAATAEGSS